MPITDTSSSTSASLIQRVREFDADAWQRLCNIYGPLVYRWVRQSGLQDTDAEDVGQEVFRTVGARIATFRADRDTDTFRGWLWTITRNKVGDFLRRQAAHPEKSGVEVADELLLAADNLPNQEPSDAYGFDSQSVVLHRALETLRVEFEVNTWQAFWRATVDNQTTSHIAEDLGITRQAVRQAKYRVLRRLRILMTEDGAS